MKGNTSGRVAFVALSLSFAVLFFGCTKRDLELRPGLVDISLAWPQGNHPASAHLHLYSSDGSLLEAHEGLTDGYAGNLPDGEYRLIVHNEDAQNVGYDGMEDHHQAKVYAMPLERDIPGEGSLLAQPHNVYGIGAHDDGETFTVRANDTTHITVRPQLLTKTVDLYFDTRRVNNGIVSLDGILEGVSPAVALSTGSSLSQSCRVAFTAEQISDPDYDREAILEVFDLLVRPEATTGVNKVGITIGTSSGEKFVTEVDLTSTLQQIVQDNGGELPTETRVRVALSLDGLGVLSATVTPWGETDAGGSGI